MTDQAFTPREPFPLTASQRLILGVAMGLATSTMLTLAFPPANLWPMAFVAFVPMVVAQFRVLPPERCAWAVCLGTDLWVLWLIVTLFGVHLETSFILLIPILVFVKDGFGAKSNRAFHRRTSYRWIVLEGAVGWVGFEMLRSFIPLIRTNGFVAYTVHTQPWMTGAMSVFGVYGLNLIIMLTNYVLAQAAIAWLDRRYAFEDEPPIPTRRNRGWLVGVGAALMVWIAIGVAGILAAPSDPPVIRVASAAHHFDRPGHIDTPESQATRLASLERQTRWAADQGAELVVWPELAIGFDPREEYTDRVVALAQETGAYVVIPFGTVSDGGSRNATVIVDPEGVFSETTGKHHPSPGEGTDPDADSFPIYETSLGRLGTIICNDANFTDSSRVLGNQGAEMMAASTLELAVPGLEMMYYGQALFRGVENRMPVVVSGNYTQAVIDAYGRILAVRAHRSDRANTPLVADLPLGLGKGTWYGRTGDWLGWVSLAGFAFFVFYPDVVKRREAKASGAVADDGVAKVEEP